MFRPEGDSDPQLSDSYIFIYIYIYITYEDMYPKRFVKVDK